MRCALGRDKKLLSDLCPPGILSGDELVLDLLGEAGSRLEATRELTCEPIQSINRREVLVLNLWPTSKNRAAWTCFLAAPSVAAAFATLLRAECRDGHSLA